MLTTVDEVIEAMGGGSACASLAGVGRAAVSNWRERGRFPSDLLFLFSGALAEKGKEADPALFGQRLPDGECVEARA